jgi:lipopolysaccharide biosynthesis protein
MVRPIAFYLPQFHPVPENDEWWGKGFTEWTNTANAKPLFEGHYQPHVPADLGFYDLRLPEARAAQARLAAAYGIEGFCYYHYWFGNGRRMLERPFEEVLSSGAPDFPFCLCWANSSWTGVWHNAPEKMLVEQIYPGEADEVAHFQWALRAFRDARYITVDGWPVFVVFEPEGLPDAKAFVARWRRLAVEAGLPGLHLLGIRHHMLDWNPNDFGLDGVIDMRMPLYNRAWLTAQSRNQVLDHRELAAFEVTEPSAEFDNHPCVGPGWDNTPRLGLRGIVYRHSSPELFGSTVRRAVRALGHRPPARQFLFLKAWNEWAEGNHLEPDLRYGHGWLEALRDGLAG